MKKVLLLILLAIFMQSCWPTSGNDDEPAAMESRYQPISLQRESFEKTINVEPSKPIVNAGKIYIKDDFIYINEKDTGFHVLDNSDPTNPKPLAFIEVPLATDLAIRNNTIYVHHSVDLVAFSYSADELEIFHRERDVFPRPFSPDGFPADYFGVPEGEIIIGYELKD